MRLIQRKSDRRRGGGPGHRMLATCRAAEQCRPGRRRRRLRRRRRADPSIAFVQGVAGDEFYISMQCGIEAEAAEGRRHRRRAGPAEVRPDPAEAASSTRWSRQQPDALLVAPTDVTAMQAPLKAAADAGIKVVLVDTTLDDPSFAVSQIASDNVGGGEAAFEAIKQLNPDGGKVLVISVDPGISTTDARVEGLRGGGRRRPDVPVPGRAVQPQRARRRPASWSPRRCRRTPTSSASSPPTCSPPRARATGVRQAGKQDQVKIVGFDAGPDQVKALKDGTVQALIAQQPAKIGEEGVQQAVAAIDGEETEPEIQTGFTIITQENVDGEAKDALYKSTC